MISSEDIMAGCRSLADMIAERVIAGLESRIDSFIGSLGEKRVETNSKYITGNNALAEFLGVCTSTVWGWKKKGLLDEAIRAEYDRIIIYDVEKVLDSLKHKPLKPGRPRLK